MILSRLAGATRNQNSAIDQIAEIALCSCPRRIRNCNVFAQVEVAIKVAKNALKNDTLAFIQVGRCLEIPEFGSSVRSFGNMRRCIDRTSDASNKPFCPIRYVKSGLLGPLKDIVVSVLFT